MKRQYRIVDEVDTKLGFNRILIQSRSLIDRILFLGWCYEESISYDSDTFKRYHKDKADAIREAQKWIDDAKSGKIGVTKTVIEVV